MSKRRSRLRYLFPIILSLAAVLTFYFFLRADVPAKIQFTQDTILDLDGLIGGDLYIAQTSECDSMEISGKDLSVTSIPLGKSFILKTIKHNRALSVYSATGAIALDFSSDDLSAGDITRWTIVNVGGPASANIVWGTPEAETWYTVNVNGARYQSIKSNGSSELAFDYPLATSSVFTLEEGGGGSAVLLPEKPDVTRVLIKDSDSGGIVVMNIPARVVQIAVSTSPDFDRAVWQGIEEGESLESKAGNICKLYIKFRTGAGAVSDTVTYYRNPSRIIEGDIVKTRDNPDVYIIKFVDSKRFKRLILSPSVFESYGHLKWENIRIISQEEMDSYDTSALVRVADDPVIYELFPKDDTGLRSVFDTSRSYDADSVYEINMVDRDSYARW